MHIRGWRILGVAAIAALGFLKATSTFASTTNYETYLESWDSNWQNVMQNLPPGPGGTSSDAYQGVTLNIAFACYNFSSAPTPSGTQFSNPSSAVSTIVSFVHSQGGKVRMSFGGASYTAPCAPNYFISQTTGWPGNASLLAAGVVSVVVGNNLDGVDFDIEDPQPAGVTPQQFASQLITFLQDVRNSLPAGKTISITIPAQGWNTYWYYLATQAAAIPGLIDYINFMEYDIWVNGSITYPEQILADILTYTSSPSTSPPPNYSPGWGIPADIVQLGLMPGCDDNQHFLSLSDAESLATAAIKRGLYGVMTWDLNRDAGSDNTPTCSTYPSNYEYSTGIRNMFGLLFASLTHTYNLLPQVHRQVTHQKFVKQFPPNHGSP